MKIETELLNILANPRRDDWHKFMWKKSISLHTQGNSLNLKCDAEYVLCSLKEWVIPQAMQLGKCQILIPSAWLRSIVRLIRNIKWVIKKQITEML